MTLLAGDGSALTVLAGETIRRAGAVLPTRQIVGLGFGDAVRLLGQEYRVVPPLWTDPYQTLRRGPQTIIPGTIALIVHAAGIGPGSRVLEAGTGSGFLTLAMAALVGDGGRVTSHDVSPAAREIARENLERAGLLSRVDILGDPVERTGARGMDAVVLDLPEPWAALDASHLALRPGGALVIYVPTTTQMERTMRAFDGRFTAPSGQEAIQRAWVLSKGGEGLRPSFEGPAHGGFLISARRM